MSVKKADKRRIFTVTVFFSNNTGYKSEIVATSYGHAALNAEIQISSSAKLCELEITKIETILS